jgi:hypothetical protein
MTRNAFGKSEPNEALTRITHNLLVLAQYYVTSHPDNTSKDLDVNNLHLNVNNLNLNAEGL